MSNQDDYIIGECQNNECFDIIKSKKTVTVPCTRNISESYTVKVPKTKAVTVNKEVPYIGYEPRTKQVPYQYFERQSVVRKVPMCRTIPITKNVCTTVRRKPFAPFLGGRSCETKKCPRTVYVTQRSCVPRQFCKTVPKTGWKTVQENVPVQKTKNVPEVQYKTEYVPEVRRRTRQVTKMVTKTVPVYNIVPKPPPSPKKEAVIQTCVPVNAVVAAYNPGYYVPVQQAAYEPRPEVAYVPTPQVRYINPGPLAQHGMQPTGISTDVLSRNENLEQALGFQEVSLTPAMTNDMAAINTNYQSGYGVQGIGGYDSGAEAAVSYSNVVDAGAECGQKRL